MDFFALMAKRAEVEDELAANDGTVIDGLSSLTGLEPSEEMERWIKMESTRAAAIYEEHYVVASGGTYNPSHLMLIGIMQGLTIARALKEMRDGEA